MIIYLLPALYAVPLIYKGEYAQRMIFGIQQSIIVAAVLFGLLTPGTEALIDGSEAATYRLIKVMTQTSLLRILAEKSKSIIKDTKT